MSDGFLKFVFKLFNLVDSALAFGSWNLNIYWISPKTESNIEQQSKASSNCVRHVEQTCMAWITVEKVNNNAIEIITEQE